MVKYLVQSAEVLNDADRFQKIMDWELFTYEQDARLFGYNKEFSWVPGVPMYRHPKDIPSFDYDENDGWLETNDWNGYWGNTVRPMIQELELPVGYTRCTPCGVDWCDGDECWVCGVSYPKGPKLNLHKFFLDGVELDRLDGINIDPPQVSPHTDFLQRYIEEDVAISVQLFNEAWLSANPRLVRGMQGFSEAASQAMAGFRSWQDLLAEWESDWAGLSGVRKIEFKIDDITVFVKTEFQEPIWGIKAFWDPKQEYISAGYVKLPRDWKNYKRAVPLPVRESLDLSKYDSTPNWAELNKPHWSRR